jgi:hypothetical protein
MTWRASYPRTHHDAGADADLRGQRRALAQLGQAAPCTLPSAGCPACASRGSARPGNALHATAAAHAIATHPATDAAASAVAAASAASATASADAASATATAASAAAAVAAAAASAVGPATQNLSTPKQAPQLRPGLTTQPHFKIRPRGDPRSAIDERPGCERYAGGQGCAGWEPRAPRPARPPPVAIAASSASSAAATAAAAAAAAAAGAAAAAAAAVVGVGGARVPSPVGVVYPLEWPRAVAAEVEIESNV